MKKIFFAALVVTVAVGGAFAGKAKESRHLTDAGLLGDPSTICNISVPCGNNINPPCILEEVQYYKNSPETGQCSIFLGRDD